MKVYCELWMDYGPMCGDRGTFQVDGRLRLRTMLDLCEGVAKERGAVGFRLSRGESLLSASEFYVSNGARQWKK